MKAARNINLRHADLTPPSGARARQIADVQGPMDETGLRQLASFAEHESTWTLGKVTAERLRMLADKLQAELEMHESYDIVSRLATKLEKSARYGVGYRINAADSGELARALRSLAAARTANAFTLTREREETERLEALVTDLRQQLAACGQTEGELKLALDAEGVSLGLVSDLRLELDKLGSTTGDGE